MKKRILACFITGILLLAGGCGNTPSPPESSDPPVTVDSGFENLEKDQIYAYEMSDDLQTLRFQGMNYYLEFVAAEGNISGLGVIDYPEQHYVAQDFGKIPASSIRLSYQNGGTLSNATGIQAVQNSNGVSSGRYWRMIEGGRYVQKIDVLKMVYDRDQEIFGRLEVKAMRESFALTYEVWSPYRVTGAALSFDFESAVYTDFSLACGERAAVLSDGENGLALVSIGIAIPIVVILLYKSDYLRYAKSGRPSLVGSSTCPWVSGRAYSTNAALMSEPSLMIHSAGTGFSSLQIMFTSAVP